MQLEQLWPQEQEAHAYEAVMSDESKSSNEVFEFE
jgi:hypothetical protein